MRYASRSPLPKDSQLVAWRSHEAGNHQLPHLQTGARRPLLRPHLRPGHRLGVSLRQVQAHEAPRRHLRKCGVEVTVSKVRRERLGHIELRPPAPTSGSSRACPRASATCSTSRSVTSNPFSTSRATSSSIPATLPSVNAKSSRTKPSSAKSTSSIAPPASRA